MRLGIYGGTFSPPHKGHTEAAKAFCRQMKLDKLLIIPTNLPPHKELLGEASPEDRLNMCRIAFSSVENAEISDMEIRRGGRSYTYLTLEELAKSGDDLYLLCGTDMILTFDMWRNFQRIFDLATICYVRRECDTDVGEQIAYKVSEYREKYSARVEKIEHDVVEISSTEIRSAILSGTATEFLDASTLRYVEDGGLYK